MSEPIQARSSTKTSAARKRSAYSPPNMNNPKIRRSFREDAFDRARDLLKRLESAVIVHTGNPSALHHRLVADLGDEITSVRKQMDFAAEAGP